MSNQAGGVVKSVDESVPEIRKSEGGNKNLRECCKQALDSF
jgi:hypothetical protein